MKNRIVLIKDVPCKLVPAKDPGMCFGCYIWSKVLPLDGIDQSCGSLASGISCKGMYVWEKVKEINKQTRTI